jgi:hypothetical protein
MGSAVIWAVQADFEASTELKFWFRPTSRGHTLLVYEAKLLL